MTEQENIQGKGVYAPEVLEFVRSANDYCHWLDDSEQTGAVGFIRSSLQIISKVYHSAVCMEEVEPVMESSNEKFVTEQDWSSVYQKVMNLLGKHNEYLRIADDDEFDRSDLVTHKISEDLADIYQDLKDFTLQYRQGIEEIMNDAVWEVMDNFDNYWGIKLLNALNALNKLYVSKVDPESDGGSPGEPE
ncbi:MAG: DUF5063 domain-containing protein, partial [Bacteroidales bacterium]|nr:DUF5063 domain-containing protein [Bacteroidales bacterium]